ncbi:MAG: asparagine synthase (glutamine-hydrolyzing) [Candidatus Hydrogenedens sp.]|nr:asparagine synthase (glutamine-hydrolyzing) [Candidatus Hydrogenedens sp.]
MCGIAGLAGLRPVNPAAVTVMTDLIAHRGPDGSGLWQSDDHRIAFGHRRLAIIDLSERGAQPMRRGELTITFNGEIYNYLELRQRLKAEGEVFDSDSDTEVILAAYQRWGTACVEEFNGMFAFCLHDAGRNRLFCARDRFGEKPFLYCVRPDLFAFASEYKALLALAEVGDGWDSHAVLRFLDRPSAGLDDARQSVFSGIRQLLPRERMVVDLASLETTVERYWDIRPDPDLARLSYADAVGTFRELLIDAVRLRLRSDVPVGSCLSGGLDSSSIVGIARGLVGDEVPYHSFTGRFPGTAADEGAFAELVIQRNRTTSHIVEPGPERFLEELPGFVWANELPVGSTSQYAQWCVFRLARENGVTVLLDGQGADEVLGGYEQYFRSYLDSLEDDADRAAETAAIRARYPAALATGRQALSKRLPPGLRRFLAHATGKGSDVLFGLKPELADAVARDNAIIPDPRFHPLAAALYRDSFQMFLSTLLRYGDRISMAHSREVRLPFCDHRIPELALNLPARHLMGEVQTKRLLRDAMAGILPEPVRTRWNKQGFLPPQDLWFRDHLGAEVEALVHDPSFARAGLWEVGWWQRLARRFRAGEKHLAWVLWRPFIFEAWRRHFLERVAAMPKISAFAH